MDVLGGYIIVAGDQRLAAISLDGAIFWSRVIVNVSVTLEKIVTNTRAFIAGMSPPISKTQGATGFVQIGIVSLLDGSFLVPLTQTTFSSVQDAAVMSDQTVVLIGSRYVAFCDSVTGTILVSYQLALSQLAFTFAGARFNDSILVVKDTSFSTITAFSQQDVKAWTPQATTPITVLLNSSLDISVLASTYTGVPAYVIACELVWLSVLDVPCNPVGLNMNPDLPSALLLSYNNAVMLITQQNPNANVISTQATVISAAIDFLGSIYVLTPTLLSKIVP
jgi:hypothetical protein